MKNARLKDCQLIRDFLHTKLDKLDDFGAIYGEDFTPELQVLIVNFLASLTDEQLSYVFMMQFLTRGGE